MDNIQSRPPIVVVLGHVDHGKSSILEAIKDFKITAKESGGITQHIGAYEVEHPSASSGQVSKITFIDTPGHEAFSAMRSRGAKVADIAILVVAAEEGIKPQTKEAISHIKKSGIPLIVAINKIDKPEANPEKVRGELAREGILVESLGGQAPSVEISAKTKKGIPELLDLIVLLGEMEKLEADAGKSAQGVVVEAYLDAKRGPTATLLLRDGVLRPGDIVGTSSVFGKVKIIENFRGETLEAAFPSQPAVVIGLENVPGVGEKFQVYQDADSARSYIAKKERKSETANVLFLEDGQKAMNFILKTDVRGSIEPIVEALKDVSQEKVVLRILKSEVGDISESDVKLAQSGNARILGFRVKTAPAAAILAERDHIKIMTFEIIYELVQAVRQMTEKTIGQEKVKINLGKMKALIIFLTEKNRQIVGGKVIEGEIKKGSSVEVIRSAQIAGTGKIINLQKNKKDVNLAAKGEECGILYEGDVKIEEGDILSAYIYDVRKDSSG